MSELTSVKFATALFVRGDYVTLGSGGVFRITKTSDTTMTIRPVYRWRWVEAVASQWEHYVWWPLRDLASRLVARAKEWC